MNLYIEDRGFVWAISAMEVVIHYANKMAEKDPNDYTKARVAAIKHGRENLDEMAEWYSNWMIPTDIPASRYRLIKSPDVPERPKMGAKVTVEKPV